MDASCKEIMFETSIFKFLNGKLLVASVKCIELFDSSPMRKPFSIQSRIPRVPLNKASGDMTLQEKNAMATQIADPTAKD